MNRVITIGREFGSGGRELGVRLANALDFAYYDKEIITAIVNHTDLAEGFVKEVVEGKSARYFPLNIGQSMNINVDYQIHQMQSIVKAQTETIKEMALKSNCVIVGRCADYILKDLRDEGQIELFRLFIYAEPESRLKRCKERAKEGENLTDKEMEKQIKRINKDRASYYEDYTLQKWGDKSNYDICLNTSFMNIESMIPHLAKLF
ncbi:MAG: cytidylate kinase-like family protein [Lachnospiraceae bacterium]|nr:cytidylate kinase-like family protein [Lachnospiraceae bacterium]